MVDVVMTGSWEVVVVVVPLSTIVDVVMGGGSEVSPSESMVEVVFVTGGGISVVEEVTVGGGGGSVTVGVSVKVSVGVSVGGSVGVSVRIADVPVPGPVIPVGVGAVKVLFSSGSRILEMRELASLRIELIRFPPSLVLVSTALAEVVVTMPVGARRISDVVVGGGSASSGDELDCPVGTVDSSNGNVTVLALLVLLVLGRGAGFDEDEGSGSLEVGGWVKVSVGEPLLGELSLGDTVSPDDGLPLDEESPLDDGLSLDDGRSLNDGRSLDDELSLDELSGVEVAAGGVT